MIITFLFAIGVAVLTTITPFLTKDIIDIYIPENNLKQIFLNLLWYFIATIVVVLMRYALQYLQTLTGMHIEKNIREEAIEKSIICPSITIHWNRTVRSLRNHFRQQRCSNLLYDDVFDCQCLVEYCDRLYRINCVRADAGGYYFGPGSDHRFWITVYRKKVHRYYLDLRETGSRITGKLNELITGALIIQDFNQEEEMMDEYKALVNRYNYNDKKPIRSTFISVGNC